MFGQWTFGTRAPQTSGPHATPLLSSVEESSYTEDVLDDMTMEEKRDVVGCSFLY